MNAAAVTELWRSRVADLFISIQRHSQWRTPPLNADTQARVEFLVRHPFRWGLPAVGAFLASPPENVGAEPRWPALLDAFDREIVAAVAGGAS